MFSKKTIFIILTLVLVGINTIISPLFITYPTLAQTPHPDPGSALDPLVTKSYVENLFRFKQLVIPTGKIVNLSVGDMFIVRSGRVKYRSSNKKALLNLTNGTEIHSESFIPANNLIIVPETGDHKLEVLSMAIILGYGIK